MFSDIPFFRSSEFRPARNEHLSRLSRFGNYVLRMFEHANYTTALPRPYDSGQQERAVTIDEDVAILSRILEDTYATKLFENDWHTAKDHVS